MSEKILFFVTEDWYFCSHRLELARAIKDAGYEVVVATRVNAHADVILGEGIRLVPLDIRRRGNNVFLEVMLLLRLYRLFRTERPDLVHNVAIMPALYGSFVALVAGTPVVVNAIAGLGYVFTSSQRKARLLRPLVRTAFRLLFNRHRVATIFQNSDDKALLTRANLVNTGRAVLIKGAGVDITRFAPVAEAGGDMPVVMLASRMLWDKGVADFVAAAKIINAKRRCARFVLVGDSDSGSRSAVPVATLQKWDLEGIVEWWGHVDDMADVLRQSSIVCLPTSYGEGVPKILIEAAASGRPIVTTDWPGCREIVRSGENGLLVPIKCPAALADALVRLINSKEQRQLMGSRGREIVVSEFAMENVIRQTLDFYERLLTQKL